MSQNEIMNNENLKEMQNIQTEMLGEFHDFCEKHNLNYISYGGTLLGAIRHNGVIPWDDDVDVAMLHDDYYKFLELSQKYFDEDYFIQHHTTDSNFTHFFTRIRKNGTL